MNGSTSRCTAHRTEEGTYALMQSRLNGVMPSPMRGEGVRLATEGAQLRA